jgi:hypothetical protein
MRCAVTGRFPALVTAKQVVVHPPYIRAACGFEVSSSACINHGSRLTLATGSASARSGAARPAELDAVADQVPAGLTRL